MASVIPFDFETNAVRIVMIDDAPWFVAADVCRVLEHSNPTVALSRLDDDERAMIDPKQSLGSNGSRGGAQEMNVVSESGLYALIFTSRTSAAQRFRKWVTGEVLPSIRRDGHFSLAGRDDDALADRRAYFAGLSDAAQEKARAKAAAMKLYDELTEFLFRRLSVRKSRGLL